MLAQEDLQFIADTIWKATAAMYDPNTSHTLQYQDLIKQTTMLDQWLVLLANEFR